jgi:hypothetical protein
MLETKVATVGNFRASGNVQCIYTQMSIQNAKFQTEHMETVSTPVQMHVSNLVGLNICSYIFVILWT